MTINIKGTTMKTMLKNLAFSAVFGIMIPAAEDAAAIDALVQTVKEGCKAEIQSYCSEVTPGEGRVLACLYAHQSKLSGRCDYALYDASAQLERAVAALTYAVTECRGDIEKYCKNIEPGQGRIADCLKKNNKGLSTRCTQAIHDIGLEAK